MVQHQHQVSDAEMQRCQEVAEHRSKLYWFLSSLFLERPSADSLEQLYSQLCARSNAPSDDGDPLLDELSAMLASETDLARFARELGIEHTRLFHGIKGGAALAPPYESVHRESRLIGETTKAVVDAYATAGYQNIHEPAGPQDHLGVELRFVSLLCFDESQYWKACDTAAVAENRSQQSDFLDKHILAWVPAYCNALERESNVRYYQIVAKLTARTLSNDRQLLHDLHSHLGMN